MPSIAVRRTAVRLLQAVIDNDDAWLLMYAPRTAMDGTFLAVALAEAAADVKNPMRGSWTYSSKGRYYRRANKRRCKCSE